MWKQVLCLAVVSGFSLPAVSGVIQVGDFRLSSGDVATQTRYDPGFSGFTTRAVLAAPVQVNSDFSGTSQESGGAVADDNDLALRTFSSVTQIRELNRFTSDEDGVGGVQRSGAVQWSFDLSPLDSYLSTNNLDLTALDLDLSLDVSSNATDRPFDVYLSYTSATAGSSLTGIGATGSSVYSTFWLPAFTSTEGDIVNGSFEVLALGRTGDQTVSDSILALYDEGVREFNLILASGGNFDERTIDITAGSGLSITTVPVPEPASLLLLGVGSLVMMGKRRP